MRRKYEKALEEWLRDEKRKPLMVLGARQVGKTYLIRDYFAESFFPSRHIYINLSDDAEMRKVISVSDSEQVLEYISRRHKMALSKDTLLIFDEAQASLGIVSLLKPFHENHPEIPIIVSGSLVTLSLNREKGKRKKEDHKLFPVGKINTLHVFPLNFEEYLLNANPSLLEDITKYYKMRCAVPEATHLLASKALDEYLSLGGMPEVLDCYFRKGDYRKSRKILSDIHDNYIGDMSFNQRNEKDLLETVAIYENIVSMLQKESEDWSPSYIEKGKRTRDYLSPLEWLFLSHTVLFCHKTKERVTLPLKRDDGAGFRLYLSDVGMFLEAAKISGEQFVIGDLDSLSGSFFENYVATELVSASLPLYYWKGKGEAEFEFLLQSKGNAIPLEVKKGRGAPRSLPKYDAHNSRKLCVKLMGGNVGYDASKRLLTLPLYMAFLLFRDIAEETFSLPE